MCANGSRSRRMCVSNHTTNHTHDHLSSLWQGHVFFAANGQSNQTKCGDCVPGTHGNWRFSGIPADWSRTLQVQHCYRDSLRILKCDSPAVSATNSYFFCGINEFCNDDGVCVPMEESTLLDIPCHSAAEKPSLARGSLLPTSTKKTRRTTQSSLTESMGTMDLCAAHGLSCISGACRICGQSVFHVHNLDKSRKRPYSGFCWNGRFSISKWKMMYALHGDIEVYAMLVLDISFFVVAFGCKCRHWIAILPQLACVVEQIAAGGKKKSKVFFSSLVFIKRAIEVVVC